MNITVDIDKELKEAIDAQQAAIDQANNLAQQKQAIIAEVLKPVEGKLKQIDAQRQNALQEALRQSGAVRRLQSLKDRSDGAKTVKKVKKT